MVRIYPLGEEIEDDPAFGAGVFVNRHSYRIKLRRALPRVKSRQKFRNPDSDFGIGKLYCWRLLQSIEILLQNLPIFKAFDSFHGAGVDSGFLGVLGRLIDFVEKAEVTGERFIC